MDLQDELAVVMGEDLSRLDFRRRTSSWYCACDSVYAVVSLQRSSWDGSVYINLGFSPVEQANRSWIPQSKCQLRFRIEAVRSVAPASLSLLSDKTLAAVGEHEWRERVRREIVAPLAEILERGVDLASLGQIVRSDLSAKVMVHRDIRARIGLPAS